MTDPRYVPLLLPDGQWIERPDLYLLARMGVPDDENDEVVRKIYEAMSNSDNSQTDLDSFDATIERHHVKRLLSERVKAGEVLLEMVRIAATGHCPPTQNKAVELTAFNHHRQFRSSSLESLKREYRRSFSHFRNTAHLQAAMVFGQPSIDEVECDLVKLVKFLSLARGFEKFIDDNLIQTNFRWSPWRIPQNIPMPGPIEFRSLSVEESRLIR